MLHLQIESGAAFALANAIFPDIAEPGWAETDFIEARTRRESQERPPLFPARRSSPPAAWPTAGPATLAATRTRSTPVASLWRRPPNGSPRVAHGDPLRWHPLGPWP